MKRGLAALIAVFLCGLWSRSMAKETEYTNMWIAEIHGGEKVAQRVARDLGYTYKSKAEPFEDHYVFLRDDHPVVSKRDSRHLTRSLLDIDEVKWAEQQAIVQRSKRGYIPERQIEEAILPLSRDEIVVRGNPYDPDEWGFGDSKSSSGSSGYGSSGYGSSGYGSSGYGSSANSNSRYGGSSSQDNYYPSQQSSGSSGASSETDNLVYVSASTSDTSYSVTMNIMKALGRNKMGVIVICGNPMSKAITNDVVSSLGMNGKLGGYGVSMVQVGSISGSAGKRTLDNLVNQFKRQGLVGNGNVAVVVSEGSGGGDSLVGQGSSSNYDQPKPYSGSSYGSSNTDSSSKPSSGANLGNSGSTNDDDAAFANLNNMFGGPSQAGSSNPSQSASSNPSKPSEASTAAGTESNGEKIIIVNIESVVDPSEFVIQKLGDKKVGSIIVSGNSVTQDHINKLYSDLSMYDKVGNDGNVQILGLTTKEGGPVNTRSIFGQVNKLTSSGKLSSGDVAVVLTTGKEINVEELSEMMAEADQGDLSKLGTFPTQPTDGKEMLSTYSGPTKHVGCLSSKESAYAKRFNDPLWPKQWYEQDYRTKNMVVMDHNIVPVYDMKITGAGIKVAVVDDGVVHNHPDLSSNFMPDLSYDFCDDVPGSRPAPPSGSDENSHGTKCAGEIAMIANNGICGVGVAYNAKVGGVRILGGHTVEYGEAKGLIFSLGTFDIYSNSWGPTDDGLTLGRVGHMTDKSFKDGITKGRNGKGSVYVFSAGNGKEKGDDNCALDGMINHYATIPIGSVSQRGKTAYYSERCTAIFAGTYSGGNKGDESVATIDINGKCTTEFSGTSAACPIASGIIALVLEANPDLTYRDVMHLITMSAEVAPVANNDNIWYKNGRGFWVSNDFGFGLMNAENMVRLAKNWKNVPSKNTCVVAVDLKSPQTFKVGDDAVITFNTDACQDQNKDSVFFLEQIELSSTIQYPFRGAISMKITSPKGTVSDILEKRIRDSDTDGLNEWSIKSVHNWGEDPKGQWKIVVTANPVPQINVATGYVQGFTLLLHGTVDMPEHYKTPRKYAAFRLSNEQTSEV